MSFKCTFILNERIKRGEYKTLLYVFLLSLFLSYCIVNFEFFIPEDIQINIYEIIPLYKWILLILSNVFILAILRSLFLKFFSKKNIEYIAIVVHIIKYGLFVMPFMLAMILIAVNKIILDTFPTQINLNDSLLFGVIYSMCFLLIWIIFLSATIKQTLFKNSVFLKSISITLIGSMLSVFISGFISFTAIIPINKYEIPFVTKVLEVQVNMELITKDEEKTKLKEYINNSSSPKG